MRTTLKVVVLAASSWTVASLAAAQPETPVEIVPPAAPEAPVEPPGAEGPDEGVEETTAAATEAEPAESANSEESGATTEHAASSVAEVTRSANERRVVPNYDGRPAPGPTATDALVWIPRIAFAPLHLVFEYVLRRPLEAFLSWVERERLHILVADFFTWDERSNGIVPTAFYDFGLLPSVGVYFFANDVGAEGHDVRAHVGFGGIDYLVGTLYDRILLSRTGGVELSFGVDAEQRPDRVYQGLGWSSDQSNRARFRRRQVNGRIGFEMHPWRRSLLRLAFEVSGNEFDPEGYAVGSGDPSLGTAVQNGTYASLPPGFDGYVAYRQRLGLRLDTREEPPAPGHGVRVDGFVEQAFDVSAWLERHWVRYGGSVAGYVDAGNERVFSLHFMAEAVDPLGSGDIPFTEQVRLGGSVLNLAGFLADQLFGRSAMVATLRYRYPIWTYIDASFFVSAGNVFGAQFEDFHFERLRLSWGLSLQSIGDRDHGLQVTVAVGTRPLVSGFHVGSVRLLLGGQTARF